jgi:hypothetical protein
METSFFIRFRLYNLFIIKLFKSTLPYLEYFLLSLQSKNTSIQSPFPRFYLIMVHTINNNRQNSQLGRKFANIISHRDVYWAFRFIYAGHKCVKLIDQIDLFLFFLLRLLALLVTPFDLFVKNSIRHYIANGLIVFSIKNYIYIIF